ncbi:unnamed protein product [marine sediment metagenome]|uniref:Pectinesterase catalytic domain-containing protein n=1 Tax=marine sediment metagenome TaxID=412755 RepID=X1SDZ4_9ZZZZ
MPMGFGAVAKKVIATKVVAADGSGDFTDIQDAINALPAGGGVVYIKEGTYTITSSIIITINNVSIIGSGASTIIDGSGFTALDAIFDVGTQNNIIFDMLYFLGNVTYATGILFTTVTDSIISNCWFDTCYEGIQA